MLYSPRFPHSKMLVVFSMMSAEALCVVLALRLRLLFHWLRRSFLDTCILAESVGRNLALEKDGVMLAKKYSRMTAEPCQNDRAQIS